MNKQITFGLAWLSCALLGTGYAQNSSYQVTITDLGLLPGGTFASAWAINDSGKIVGMANDASGAFKTVEWVNGQIAVIPDLAANGGLCVPEDLNDAGESAGRQSISGFFSYAIFWDTQNSVSALPGLPSGSPALAKAHAISANGTVVGLAKEGGPNYWGHAVVWQQGTLQADLGFMGGGNYSEAYGVNDLGAVVGVASIANTNQHGFLWQNGQFTDLSTWSGGGVASKALAINNHGEIVGLNASVASQWKNGAVSALDMPPGISAYTSAVDINDAGDIIATGSKGYPFEVGVLWRNGTPIDLGTLPGGSISRARRINDTGEIVGEAQAADGYFHAVKWTVTPKYSSTYCTAKTSSLGCMPDMGSSGVPSLAAPGAFLATVDQVNGGQSGLMFFGTAGQASAPFMGGTLCVAGPLFRLSIGNSGGTPGTCSGSASYSLAQMLAHPSGGSQLVVNQNVNAQHWFRDPADPQTVGLSNGLQFTILP